MLYDEVSRILAVASNSSTPFQIYENESALTVAQLLFLEAEDTSKPIHLYINSPGGSVTAGLAIYDTVSIMIPHL